MSKLNIRRAEEKDIPVIDKLLYQVHKVHSDARPDLFKQGAKKYNDEQLKEILADDKTPVFVAEKDGVVAGYAFCIHKQFINDNNMTDVKTLYIDDLCVDEKVRGEHIGSRLYEYVLDYAKAHGYYNVTLNVWADNKQAVGFYEKIGLKIQKIGMEKICKEFAPISEHGNEIQIVEEVEMSSKFSEKEKQQYLLKKHVKDHIFEYVLDFVGPIILVIILLKLCKAENLILGIVFTAAFAVGKIVYEIHHYKKDYIDKENK